jgi:hypothetical protein
MDAEYDYYRRNGLAVALSKIIAAHNQVSPNEGLQESFLSG